MSVQTEEVLRNDRELVRLYAAERGSISRPIAHRKAAISRAIAVVTTVWRLPAAISRRYRAHSRSYAFQAIARTIAGKPSWRSCSTRLIRAGKR